MPRFKTTKPAKQIKVNTIENYLSRVDGIKQINKNHVLTFTGGSVIIFLLKILQRSNLV